MQSVVGQAIQTKGSDPIMMDNIIKTLILSAVFHYIFVMYFPLDLLKITPPELTINMQLVANSKTDEPQNQEERVEENPGEISGEGNLSNFDENKWHDLIARLEKNTGFSQNFNQTIEDLNKENPISDVYINRNRHHEDIVVKEVFPTIHDIDEPFEEILKAAPEKLDDYLQRDEIIEQYRDPQLQKDNDRLQVDIVRNTNDGSLGALDFPEPARQVYFDNTLQEDKTQQLATFIENYFKYDPNDGDLPIAIRELYYQNLERLLYSFSSDPTYFYLDYYLENLNKEDFLNHALYQASRLDGSKTATELLFIIEEIYKIQQRAWLSYFQFNALYEKIPPEKRDRLRVETLKRVGERYKEILENKDIKRFQDIENKYRQRRLEIIEHIIKNSPQNYRLQDAYFEYAAIKWEMGVQNNDAIKKNEAIVQWQSIINQAKNKSFTQNEKDNFINLPHLNGLEQLLNSYQASSGNIKQQIAINIRRFLIQRNKSRIETKREREEKILWPKNPTSNKQLD